MSCVNHIKSFLNVIVQKDHEKHKKFRSVFGGILFFIGFGGVSTWGNLNIYFFSYFHENNKSITPNQNNLILSIVGIPLLVITSFSIQIAEKIGFKKVISFFGIIYGISTIISSFCNDIYSFSLFYNIIPSWSIGFSLNPALYCVWANFPEIKGKISGN